MNRCYGIPLPLLGLCALAAPGFAEILWTTTDSVGVSIAHPPAGTSYGRVLAGDFDANGSQDLVYLAGSRLDAMLNLGLYESPQTAIATGVSDFSVVPRVGGGDSLLILTAAGLSRIDFDASGPGGQYWTTPVLLDAGAAGSSGLHSFDLGNGDKFLFDIGQGSTIRSNTYSGGLLGTPSSYTTGATGTFEKAVAIDWDGNGTPDLAVASSTGISVYQVEPTGSVLFTQALTDEVVALTGVVYGGAASVAYVSVDPVDGISQTLGVFGGGASWSEAIGTPQLVSLMPGDLDANGHTELIASDRYWDLTYLPIQPGPGGPSFPWGSRVHVDHGSSTTFPPNEGPPGMVDLDGDGDLDACMPLDPDHAIWVHYDSTVDASIQRPRLWTTVEGWGGGVDTSRNLGFFVEWDANVPGTHLEVAAHVRRQDQGYLFDSDAFFFQSVDISGAQAGHQFFSVTVPVASSVVPANGFNELVYLTIQSADLDASSDPIQTYPGINYVLHADGVNSSGSDYVSSLGSDTIPLLVQGFEAFWVDPPDGDTGGSGIDTPCVPPPPGGAPTGTRGGVLGGG